MSATIRHIDQAITLVSSAKSLLERPQFTTSALASLSDALLELRLALAAAQADATDLGELTAYRAVSPSEVARG